MSFDTSEDNAAFRAKYNFEYPLLCDRDRTMGLAYGAAKEAGVGGSAKRIGVVINPEGTVIFYAASVNVTSFPQAALDMM